MECPNLESESPCERVCRAQRSIYVPDDDELMTVCTTDRHRRCPLYLNLIGVHDHLCRLEVERAVG